jgi:hypothetical protein
MATFCRLDFITINTYARFYVRQYGRGPVWLHWCQIGPVSFERVFALIFRYLFSIIVVSVGLYRISYCTER